MKCCIMLNPNFYLFCLMHMIVGFKFEFGVDFFEFKRGKKGKGKRIRKKEKPFFSPLPWPRLVPRPTRRPPSPERVAQSSSCGPSGTPPSSLAWPRQRRARLALRVNLSFSPPTKGRAVSPARVRPSTSPLGHLLAPLSPMSPTLHGRA
jgi:hypothetical protein